MILAKNRKQRFSNFYTHLMRRNLFSSLKAVISGLAVCTALVTSISNHAYAQTYATGATPRSGSVDCALGCLGTGVTSPGNAATSDNTTKAIMVSEKSILGTSGGSAFLTLRFPANVDAQKTVYVKIDAPVVTGLLTGVLGIVGLAGTNITATLRNGATTSVDGTSIAATTKIVTDVTGTNYFLAISPGAGNVTQFNAVRILVESPNLDLASSITMNVYNAFYYPDGGPADCGLPQYISLGEGSGLTVEVLTNPFVNPKGAIDGNLATSAQIGSGLANVGVFSELSQTVFLKNKQPASDQIVIYFSTGAAVADVSLLGGLSVQAYSGEQPIATASPFSSLLNLTLLGYPSGLPANTVVPIYLTPSAAFDRVKITLSNTVNLTVLGGGIFIRDIAAVPPKPTLSSKLVYQFAGATPAVTATSSGTSIVWRGPLPAITDLATSSPSPASFPTTVSSNGEFIAVAYTPGCSVFGSDSTKLRVVVLEDASTTIPAGVNGAPIATGGSIKASSTGHTFNYTSSGLPSGLTLNATTGAITGTPTQTGNFSVTVNIFEGLVNTGLTLTKSVTVYPPIVFTGGSFAPVNINSPSYSQNISTAVTLPAAGGKGSSFYVYSLSPMLSGGGPPPLAVPTGLSLSTGGVISGDPSAVPVGDYTFLIYVNDGVQEVSSDFTISFVDVPLPVTLSEFKAQKEGMTSILTWATTEEVNFEKFEIQHSNEGKNWVILGERQASQSGKSGQSYSFVDMKPSSGSNLYRLKMIDLDGSFAYSKKVTLDFGAAEKTFAYPNPLGKSQNLEINNGDYRDISSIQILDIAGRKIIESRDISSALTSTSGLNSGLYVIRMESKGGKVTVQRLIKN